MQPLATTTDLEDRIGRSLTSAEAARAPALLSDASALIRRYCRKDFLYHEDDVKVLRASGPEIVLPYRPVQEVSSVIAKSGRAGVPDIPVTWWTFDGIDRLFVADASSSGVVNLPEDWYSGTFPDTFQVTYTHGYPEVPPEATGVCANVVLAVLLAPTMAAGVIGEVIGPYSYRVVRAGGGVAVALQENDLAQLRDFRDTESTLFLGGGRLWSS
jgi:hypothetical protein